MAATLVTGSREPISIRAAGATAKDERFVFAYEDILGFRLSNIAVAKDRAPAGFGR